jgi:LacI family transcriptional regulator
VFITGSRNGKSNQDIGERVEGYTDAMKKHQLTIEDKWMLAGDWSMGSGYNIAQRLCNSDDRPDAIIFASDRMALGALKGLHDLELKVPANVSIVGFDNMQYDEFSIPPLTSVHSPILDMSEAAVEILLKLMEDNSLAVEMHQPVFPAELVIRESTA